VAKWTDAIDALAFHEGWNVFYCDDKKHRIQRIDYPPDHFLWNEGDPIDPIFNSDDEAIAFVRKRAAEGAEHALLALELTGE
jgi:hypothetical protein